MAPDFDQSDDFKHLYAKALDYLAKQEYSERKLLQKILSLKKRYPQTTRYKNYTENNIRAVLSVLKGQGLLNEERALREKVTASRSGIYGMRRIKEKCYIQLYEKENIEKVFKEFQESEVAHDLTAIIKKVKFRKESLERRYKDDPVKLRTVRDKLMQFLVTKGFDYDDIKKVLENISEK